MDKESIFWILLILALLVLTVYFKVYNNQSISLSVNISSGSLLPTVYPYQKVMLPIFIKNYGGTGISRIPVEVFINGSQNIAYSITIPVGKVAALAFNFTPGSSGKYNVTVVADPGKLYSISDRALAQNSTLVVVSAPQTPTAYGLLPWGNVINYQNNNMGVNGLILASYISGNYSAGAFSPVGKQDGFLLSILNLTRSYISQISVAYSSYQNGDFADSVWISGTISPSILDVAASAKGYKTTNFSFDGVKATKIIIDNSTTLCGWYQEGWIKTLFYQNSTQDCTKILNETGNRLNTTKYFSNNTLYNKVLIPNLTVLGSFNSISLGGDSYSSILSTSAYFVLPEIGIGTGNSICYGSIESYSNLSLCSIYTLPNFGSEFIKTTAYIGNYNASVFMLVNNSPTNVSEAVSLSELLIHSFGLKGNSISFSSGLVSTCDLGDNLSCANIHYFNGTLNFSMTNRLNQTVTINMMGCYKSGGFIQKSIDKKIISGGRLNVSLACYNNGALIAGTPLKLTLNLLTNYTIEKTDNVFVGNATVILTS